MSTCVYEQDPIMIEYGFIATSNYVVVEGLLEFFAVAQEQMVVNVSIARIFFSYKEQRRWPKLYKWFQEMINTYIA